MSQSVVWACDLGTTTRNEVGTTSGNAGSGGSQRFYVGRRRSGGVTYDYNAYARFALNWSGVGKIISATLTLTTDDGLGQDGSTIGASTLPHAYIRRLTSLISEHSNSAVWTSGDYNAPSYTTSAQIVNKPMSAGALDVTNIDITDFAEAWAPASVKRRNGTPGGKAANYGIGIMSNTKSLQNWAGISEDATASPIDYSGMRPYVTLVYELGTTIPDAPVANLNPSGAVVGLSSFQGDFTDSAGSRDHLVASEVQVFDAGHAATAAVTDLITSAGHGLVAHSRIYFTSLTAGTGLTTYTPYYVLASGLTSSAFKVAATSTSTTPVDISVAYTAMTWSVLIYDKKQNESAAASLAARFDHVPTDLTLAVNTTYRWRGRVYDNESTDPSPYGTLTSFSVTNTAPTAPTITPASGKSVTTLANTLFRGSFSDANVGDTLFAYQVQLSAYASGDPHWDDDEFILWNTGKRYVTSGSTQFETGYTGAALAAGTYYWRARVWDSHDTASAYTYATIVVSADFVVDPHDTVHSVQQRPEVRWRIVIKAMGALRGPGATVAILEDAKNVGATLLYNSPGEAHWTLGANHPQLSVIEPKQTHYAIEFRQGDGWREAFAGLVDDFDATANDIVFYGVDYLGLLQRVLDEKYDPAKPDRDYAAGGSKYSNQTVTTIVTNQLLRARQLANSPVGFITTGSIDAMNEHITVYSTYQSTLTFIVSLLDTHKAGTGHMTRLYVKKVGAGYQFYVDDNPGTQRDNLRLRYGELVQGYRVVAFGKNWGTRVSAIGRDQNGIKVRYSSQVAPGISETTWGRFMIPTFIDGVIDQNDLTRRALSLAYAASKLGSQIGVGIRSGFLLPRDGYDLMDQFPISIVHGAVDTSNFGSGYWVAVGITFQALERGDLNTTLTFRPRQDTHTQSSDLLSAVEISTQPEWQVGWKAPVSTAASSKYWLDQSTGKVYTRTDGALIATGITGTV